MKNFLPLKLRTPEKSNLLDESISKKIEVEECYIEHMGENDRYGYEFQTLLQGKNSKSSCLSTVITPSVVVKLNMNPNPFLTGIRSPLKKMFPSKEGKYSLSFFL